jgi:Ni/Co efflux regulator RcnB
MNKKQLIPTLALATILGAGMTLPMTASADERPNRHDRVEQNHKKPDRNDRHDRREFGHNKPVHFDQGRHYGHDKHYDRYRYRDGYRYGDRYHHKWHKPYPRRYYETYRPHHHYYDDDGGRIRVIFDYDILM